MNILLVEDHTDSRLVLANLLKHCGHQVAVAQSLAEAHALLAETPFEILLTDIGLPDGDAYGLAAEAKASPRLKKAVALSARVTDDEQRLGREAGFDHYLTKPVDFHQLRMVLAEA